MIHDVAYGWNDGVYKVGLRLLGRDPAGSVDIIEVMDTATAMQLQSHHLSTGLASPVLSSFLPPCPFIVAASQMELFIDQGFQHPDLVLLSYSFLPSLI
jgi:hypothetical protein